MMVKKIFLLIILFFSILYSNTNILWDMGVIIESNNPKNIPANQSLNETNKILIKSTNTINAVISDPFIPPSKKNILDKNLDSSNILKNNIFKIYLEAKKLYLLKKYKNFIELIQNRDLSSLNRQNRFDLEYKLADAFYKTGNYEQAKNHVLLCLQNNKTDNLYMLLGMVYESLELNNDAKNCYLKLINHFPKSEYNVSAKIKIDMLKQNK